MFKSATAALLAGCIVLLSPGLGGYAAAAGAVARSASGRTGRSGLAAIPTLGASAGQTASTVKIALAPAALAGLGAYRAQAADSGRPAAAVRPSLQRSAAGAHAALPAAAIGYQAPASAPAAIDRQESALEAAQSGLQEAAASLSAPVSAENLYSASAVLFTGRVLSGVEPQGPRDRAVPAVLGSAASGYGPRLSRAAAVVGAVTASAALSAGPALTASAGGVSLGHKILDGLGWSGNMVGNGLGMVFALPQILKTFKDGNASGTPKWRAVVGTAASLALGLVNAPLDGQSFWGVQNLFGALTLIAPLAIGPVLARGPGRWSARAIWGWTAAVSLGLLAASIGMYAGAAAVMPVLLHAVFSPAGLGWLTLGIQVATGGMLLLLFVPDIVSLLKKQAPEGFTSMFSMLFFVASLAFVVWTLQQAWDAPAGSKDRIRYLVYCGQNVLYAVVSGVSYILSRRHERGA
ncbi:MAG: hypothetical protein WC881_09920 [Elusimicrobiota bacterium]|jgi:hypothetical protein